ncbi:MAG: 4-(cytidine 5'-diphospho)-2-C-methyl-D-erythritol kinase [Candidatus Gastranaerophilales bacterium]|nr:4-(cytidine 5'-diphospho)-2-C-methyl-D-erythritol kinase [Candidatus Gastranaerophilales bacterium]
MKQIKVKTPAKINLVLEIVGKREDGFHEIQSIMQAISIFDILTINVEDDSSENITISGDNPHIPYNQDNIAFKAAKLFLDKTGIANQKINIHIEKHIPVAGGMAGGSSNAAGVLWGLNRLYGSPLTEAELHSLAAKLGSDVNFCLVGGNCSATSRGEIIQPLSTPELAFMAIKPAKLFISAKEAYERYAALPAKPAAKNFEKMKEKLLQTKITDEIANLLNNHLEDAILPAYPAITRAKQFLHDCGCKSVLMSGSGPSVFGICMPDTTFSSSPDGFELFKAVSIRHGVIELTD